jgi:hypothetical protein
VIGAIDVASRLLWRRDFKGRKSDSGRNAFVGFRIDELKRSHAPKENELMQARSTKRVLLLCAAVLILVIGSSRVFADTVGQLTVIDVVHSGQSGTVDAVPGDMIKLTASIPLVGNVPTVTNISGSSAAAVGSIVLEPQAYSQFFVANSLGVTNLTFTYVPQGAAQPVVRQYTIVVTGTRPARLIQVTAGGLTDVATGLTPIGGARVNDVLFYSAGSPATISVTVTGTALVKAGVVVQNGTDVVYFAAAAPGTGSFSLTGFISPQIVVSP